MTTTEANNFLLALQHIRDLNALIEFACKNDEHTTEAIENAEERSKRITTYKNHEGLCMDDMIGGVYDIDRMTTYLNKKIWSGETTD